MGVGQEEVIEVTEGVLPVVCVMHHGEVGCHSPGDACHACPVQERMMPEKLVGDIWVLCTGLGI